MTSFEDVEAKLLSAMYDCDWESDEATKMVRNYQTLANCRPKPPLPPPVEKAEEPTPNWIERHSDTLIKSGFALLSVVAIVGGEKLGNHLYNTKAWNAIPK